MIYSRWENSMKETRSAQLQVWSIQVVNRGSLVLLFFLFENLKRQQFGITWSVMSFKCLKCVACLIGVAIENNSQSGCCWEQHDMSVKWERVRKSALAYTSWGSLSAPSPYFSLFLIRIAEAKRMRACFLRYCLGWGDSTDPNVETCWLLQKERTFKMRWI